MGKFVTLEGIEGVGKTSNLRYIKQLLETGGQSCVVTREPGGTRLGEALRGLLLSHSDENMSADAELLMMFAARAEHLDKVILPALERGQTVLCGLQRRLSQLISLGWRLASMLRKNSP